MDKIKRDELAAEECLRRYQRICPEIVLADYKGYAGEIRNHNKELQKILELSAIEGSEVRGSNISSPTEDTAVKRVDLAMQIAVLERMGELVEKALNKLTDQQREIIDVFFFKKGLTGYNVQEYADKNYMSIASVYRERRQALNEFAEIYEEYIGL